jgi:hypothetical protein
MKQKLTITVPKNWSAVTLKQYLTFRDELESYKDDQDAVEAVIFQHLCGVDAQYLHLIDNETITHIRGDLAAFMQQTDYELQRFVTIGGVEYGFEPNLSQMTYGAYLDITKFDTITIDKNWGKIMSILYRPVTKKIGQLYEIEPYNADIDDSKFLTTTMDLNFGALFFFIDLSNELLTSIQNSLKSQQAISPNIKSILERSGKATRQSLSSLEVIF